MILSQAKKIFDIEINGLKFVKDNLDENFELLVNQCFEVIEKKNKIIISGIGKSGLIAKKICSSFNSIGIQSVFLHPIEAVHGDLGMVSNNDIVLILSYSGEGMEITNFTKALKKINGNIWAITGKNENILTKLSKNSITLTIEQEADYLNLLPSTSSTSQLVFGHALGICLMDLKKFRREDFSLFHPGGNIGDTLNKSIKDFIRTGEKLSLVKEDTLIRDVVFSLCQSQGGTAIVTDEQKKLKGIFTTGDLKRGLNKDKNLLEKTLDSNYNKNPLTIDFNASIEELFSLFQKNKINSLVVLENNKIKGLIDIQDLAKLKFFSNYIT